MNLHKQFARLNAFGFLSCLRVTDAVWVVFLVSRGYSLWQVGLAESIFHAVSLLCEIPSGMAADLMGRRRSLAVSGLCGLVSALLMVGSRSFFGVCGAMTFSALSCSFISGSDEALLYDSLLACGEERHYISVSARFSQAQNLGSILSNVIILMANLLGYWGIYLLDACICLCRMGAALLLREPAVTVQQAAREKHPFRNLSVRLRAHVGTAVSFLRTQPQAAALMLADGLINLPAYLTLMLLQQRLCEQGIAAMWLGVPVMCIGLARMAGTAVGRRLRGVSLRVLYGIAAITVSAGTVCAGMAPVIPAVIGAMLAASAMDAWVLHLQRRLNGLFPSNQRATLVSVNMMAYSLLMVAVSPLVGWLGDITAMSGAGLCVPGIAVGLAGMVVLLRRK